MSGDRVVSSKPIPPHLSGIFQRGEFVAEIALNFSVNSLHRSNISRTRSDTGTG
jgi:hypothetical protein